MVRQITEWFYKAEMMNGVDYMIKFFCRVGKKGLFAHRIAQMLKVGVQRNHLHTLPLFSILAYLLILGFTIFILIFGGIHFLAYKNIAKANVSLGYLYQNGLVTLLKDAKKAKNYFSKAAALGDIDGSCALGELYEQEGYYEEALPLYFKSALHGSQRCEVNFSKLTFTHEEKVFESLMQYAAKSNTFAEFSVGTRYIEGKGVEKSVERGLYYLNKAAANKHKGAKIYLAGLYLKGEVVKQDYDLANKWLDAVKK